jgi:hypothetical protein
MWNGSDYDTTFQVRRTTTTASGAFSFKDLRPASYVVLVDAEFPRKVGAPCASAGMVARTRDGLMVLRGELANGGLKLIVTSKPISLSAGGAPAQTIDVRCQ